MGPDSYLPEADLKANIINPLEMLLSNDVIDAMERQGFRDEVSAVKAFRKIVDDMVQETKFRSTNHLATSFALSDSDTSILQQLCTALKSVDTSRLRDIVSNPDNPIPETEILADILQLHGKFQKLIRFHKVFEGLFFDQPFQVSAGNLYGLRPREEHLALQFNPTWSQRHSTIMKDMGQIWVDNHLRAVRVEDHLRAATVEDHLRAVTVEDVEKVQISLIQNLSEAIRDELFAFKSIPETTESLLHIQATIKKEVARVRNAKFIIAFCGMVKAGKSLFLNALTGTSILPSDELPSTAWPCRVRHVEYQREPILLVDPNHFKGAIDAFKTSKFSATMGILEDLDDTDSWDDTQDESDVDVDLTIGNNCIDLHPTTKENLLRFEKDDYCLLSSARGEKDVSNLLAQVNDIVRLCSKLRIPPPSQEPGSWPLLKVEFECLRGQNVSGEFEFIDLPGLGELSHDDDNFENLVRGVAKEANAIVPIVSFKEASRLDWRQLLPDIIKDGLGRAPDLVLCTHLDQVVKDRVEQQVSSIAAVFWPNSDNPMYRVLPCSSRMGISARALLRKSTDGKPDFKDIYEENNDAYDCAQKLLGTAIPEKKLEQYPLTDWREDISKELKESKLELAVTCLTKEIVMKERSHVLSRENKQLIVEIKKLIYDQRRLILAMGRSTQELDDAYRAFNNISSKMKQVLQKWDTEESRIKSESTYVFQRAFKVLEAQALDVAMQAIENTLHEFPWREKAEQLEDANDLVFQRKSDIEAFLVSVQQEMRMLLAPIKRNFVTSVRQLANQSHTKLFDSLKATIQGSIVVNGQSELIEDIADQLTPHDYEIGLLSTISDKVVHAVVSGRHTNVGYFNDISNANASDRARDVGQLGFMLRAPAAVLATISQLSVDLWRFIQRSKTYVLSKGALSKELQCHVIRPYFEDLRKEGHCTLNDTIMKSSQVARQRVEFSLQEEKRRFSQEKERRSAQEQELEVLTPAIGSVAPSMDLATSSMAILVNLLAAQTGLLRLQEHLEDVTLCINN